jgi:hypothetical protein
MFLAYMAIKWTIKLTWLMVVGSLWLCWAVVAVPASIVASARGNQRSAREWQRSLRWGRMLL